MTLRAAPVRVGRGAVYAFLASFTLASCGAPGAPILAPPPPGAERATAGCATIAGPESDPGLGFVTDFYLTTAGSAFKEGAAAGAIEGAGDGAGAVAQALFPTAPRSFGGREVVPTGASAGSFCRVIERDLRTVTTALDSVLAEIAAFGYAPAARGGPQRRATAFAARGHAAADWIDRYAAYAIPLGPDRTALRVWREIYISRGDSPYVEATSVGGNEAWLLWETERRAEQR